ncbi:hypothetical protein J6590_007015 [Homalodisca vitripennis]|nr:hypothetical protein J6590_007015 [Homalodisca vitripennis]
MHTGSFLDETDIVQLLSPTDTWMFDLRSPAEQRTSPCPVAKSCGRPLSPQRPRAYLSVFPRRGLLNPSSKDVVARASIMGCLTDPSPAESIVEKAALTYAFKLSSHGIITRFTLIYDGLVGEI